MAIPLFKLPFLVIKLIFETMGFIEIFVLTSTSSKTKRIVKNLVSVRNCDLQLFLKNENFVFDYRLKSDESFDAPFYLAPNEYHQLDNVFQLKIGSSDRVPSALSTSYDGTTVLSIYWDQSIDNGTKLYNALFDVFKLTLAHVEMDLDDVSDRTYKSWINWNNDLFRDIPILDIVGKCSFSDYTWISKNVRTKHQLVLRVEPANYPEDPEAIEILDVEVPNIIIHHGRWISIRQLKSIRASSITIDKSSFTDSQFNTVLRDLKNAEGPSNLKQLNISFNREADPDTFLQGLDVTDEHLMKPEDAFNQWSFEMTNGNKCTIIYADYATLPGEDDSFGLEIQISHSAIGA